MVFQGLVPLFRLPEELLEALFLALDLRSTLTFRQTCKRLYSVSKSRVIWLAMYATLEPLVSPYGHRTLDKPLRRYKPEEIERIVLKMAALETNWTLNPRPVNTFQLAAPSDGVLVAGGRWYIVTNGTLSTRILCYDLTASDLKPYVLIEIRNHVALASPHFRRHNRIFMWIEECQGSLAFELAIRHQPDKVFEIPSILSFWNVRYSEETDRLTATPLHSYLDPPTPFYRPIVAFTGNFIVADITFRPDELPRFVIVTEWRNCTSDSHSRAIVKVDLFHGEPLILQARILPQNQLLLASPKSVAIFNIPEFKTMDKTQSLEPTEETKPVWWLSLQPATAHFAILSEPTLQQTLPNSKADLMFLEQSCLRIFSTTGDPSRPMKSEARIDLNHFPSQTTMLPVHLGGVKGFWTKGTKTEIGFSSYRTCANAASLGYLLGRDLPPHSNHRGEWLYAFVAYAQAGPGAVNQTLWRFDAQSGTVIKWVYRKDLGCRVAEVAQYC